MIRSKLSCFCLACFIVLFVNCNLYAFDGEILTPNKLNPGDTICVLESSYMPTGGSRCFGERLPIVIDNLRRKGFSVVIYEECFKETPLGIGDGTEKLRADLFNQAVTDPKIKAILAFWGGCGAVQILDKIDYDAFRERRKIFVGFSDETALELAIFEKAGVITFHGPMIGCSLNYRETETFDNLFDILMNPRSEMELKNIDDETPFEVFKTGEANGEIIGGNLTLIQCSVGTPYEPNWENKILFFEEVDEDVEAIFRMLNHIKSAGILDKLKGIIIGKLTPVEGETEDELLNVCFYILKDLDVPIVYNIHAGHVKNPLTLPIGAEVKISGDRVYVTQQVID